MPKSTCDKDPLFTLKITLLPAPVTIYGCLFKALSANNKALIPALNQSGTTP